MAHKQAAARAYAVILVGGKGKRLRPLSTRSRPKAFLSIMRSGRTMFGQAAWRITKVVPSERVVIVAGGLHAGHVRKDFPALEKENLILEPVSRNTAPAIAFAAAILEARDPCAVMVVLPADQYILDEKQYLDSIRSGIRFVKDNADAIVVLGVRPTYPATGFGYIRIRGRRAGTRNVYAVRRFTEKPDLKTAERFVKDGRYLWNTGAFIFRPGTVLAALERFAPAVYAGFSDLRKARKRYRDLPDISIDYAVMEKAKNISCVKGRYRWQDVGTFGSLADALKRERRKFITDGERIVRII